jgi:hypothetical protein
VADVVNGNISGRGETVKNVEWPTVHFITAQAQDVRVQLNSCKQGISIYRRHKVIIQLNLKIVQLARQL